MAHAGHRHHDSGGIGGGDYLVVGLGTARLDHRRGAGLDQRGKSVGKREKRIRGGHRPDGARRVPSMVGGRVARLLCGNAGRIDTAHLAGADTDGAAVAGEDDGVRFHMLADAPGEHHVVDLTCIGLCLCHDPQIRCRDRPVVPGLGKESAAHRFEFHRSGRRIGHRAGDQKAQVRFLGKNGAGLVIGVRGDYHLGENTCDGARRFGVQFHVGGDDPAKGADRVGGQRVLPCGGQIRRRGNAAGIGVFDNGDGRVGEFGGKLERGIGVVQIVVGQRLALKLCRRGDAGPCFAACVYGGPLMRVLAIAQFLKAAPDTVMVSPNASPDSHPAMARS